VAKDRLFDSGYLESGSDRRRHYEDALRRLLSDSPGGTNTVLVGHMPQLNDVAGVVLQEGEAAVIRPEGGGFKVVRRVWPDGWDGLGR